MLILSTVQSISMLGLALHPAVVADTPHWQHDFSRGFHRVARQWPKPDSKPGIRLFWSRDLGSRVGIMISWIDGKAPYNFPIEVEAARPRKKVLTRTGVPTGMCGVGRVLGRRVSAVTF